MRLSIAIPTYNRKPFLQKTLEALMNQITEGVEIVVSDNASTDQTSLYLYEQEQNLPYLKIFIQKENLGIDRNILNALTNCQGKYVFFLGDDDIVLPGSLEKILKEVEKETYDVICLNHHPYFERKKKVGPSFLPNKNQLFFDGEQFFCFAGLGFISSILFKREKGLKFVKNVQVGFESAHLELASRTCLSSKGPFLFLGTVSIQARAPEVARYDLFRCCILYLKGVYETLYKEKLLSAKGKKILINRLIFKEIPRIVYKSGLGHEETVKGLTLLKEAFKEDVYARLIIFFLDKTPKQCLKALFKVAKFFKRVLNGF